MSGHTPAEGTHAAHTDHDDGHAAVEGAPSWTWLLLIIVVIVLLLAGCCGGDEEETAEQAKLTASAPVRTVVVTEKVGKVETFYRFADWPDGCVEEKMEEWNFRSVLQGKGKVMVYPPHGAPPFEDEPGAIIKTAVKPGWWKWCKKEHGPEDGVRLFR